MTETEKELSNRITELSGKLSHLEVRFNQTKDFCYRDIAALQKRCNELEIPDVHFQVVRRKND
jgi:hypothetical protein